MQIVRRDYNPFIMGGKVNRLIKTELPDGMGERYDLGRGFHVVIVTANNKTMVFEEKSGAHVGSTLEAVKKDFDSCSDTEFMIKQVMKLLEEAKDADEVSFEEFF